MKKLFLAFVMVFGIVSVAFSQNWFVGAGVNFGFTKDSEFYNVGENIVERGTGRITVGISPEIGYKINKFNVGINPIIQYNYYDNKQDSSSSSQNNLGFGIGLFSRYNFITFFDRLSILGRMDVRYIYSKMEREGTYQSGNTSKHERIAHGINLSISPVIEFKLSNRFSLYSSIIGDIASIGYEYSSVNGKNGNEYSGNGHNFVFSLPFVHNYSLTNISLGFYVTF